jgi:FAD-dependent oxidoreductase domain-containing protein 1
MTRPSVVIVGGGVLGAATACFLARDHGATVTVLERDPSHRQASSTLSASSIRQQFSTPINIALSQASIEFLRRVGDELAVDGERPAIGLVEAGYLYLASAGGEPRLRANQALQRAHGADIELLDAPALRARWPWLSTTGLALGAHGVRGEGWFDGPALHAAFSRKARACGARFVHADVLAFDATADRVHAVRDARGQAHAGDAVLVAAGAWSAPLAAALGLSLPVSAKKRDVFVLDSPARLPGCPLIIDPSGVWLRPEGAGFIAGAPPRRIGNIRDADDLPLEAIDHGLFDDVIWPTLAARIPALEALRVRSAWAGYYEMNAFDHNGVVGAVPGWTNAFIACGFSGHGMQHAPALGRALAQRIATGHYAGLDLTPLAAERLQRGEPLIEHNVI